MLQLNVVKGTDLPVLLPGVCVPADFADSCVQCYQGAQQIAMERYKLYQNNEEDQIVDTLLNGAELSLHIADEKAIPCSAFFAEG